MTQALLAWEKLSRTLLNPYTFLENLTWVSAINFPVILRLSVLPRAEIQGERFWVQHQTLLAAGNKINNWFLDNYLTTSEIFSWVINVTFSGGTEVPYDLFWDGSRLAQ